MPVKDLVIGLDSSTTSCKAIIWDLHGKPVASGRAPLPLLQPRPSWHEQPAETWWSAVCTALRQATAQIDAARLAAISIAVQRETFVVTDAEGNPLYNALVWMDERCRALLPEMERMYGKERIHRETGKVFSANLSSGKLFWLRQERPDLFKRIAYVMDVHAFLVHRLTGRFATSQGCADPMGLFDMPNHRWDADLIHTIGLSLEQFPEALPVGSLIGAVQPAAAQQTGLPEGLPVAAGLGDGQAAGLGVCAAQPGLAYLNLGTAVVSGTYSETYLVDPAFRTHYGGIPGSYALETVILGGTYTISWFIKNFSGLSESELAGNASPEALLEAAAAQVPPGALGLMLVPYWNSAMNPYWDASASGIMVGWRGIHQRDHFYRAILEGIAFELRLDIEGVEQALGQPVNQLIAVGGGAKSSLWRQIIADVTGKVIYHAEEPEATALGAGILAATAAGSFPDVLSAAQSMTHVDPHPLTPDPQNSFLYNRLYQEVYRDLFPALRTYLHHLANLTSDIAPSMH